MKTNYTIYGEGGFDPSQPGGNVTEQGVRVLPGLSAAPMSIKAGGVIPTLVHWAGELETATWSVNGLVSVEPTTLDEASGLRVSEIEVVSAHVGSVLVTCNGETLRLEASL